MGGTGGSVGHWRLTKIFLKEEKRKKEKKAHKCGARAPSLSAYGCVCVCVCVGACVCACCK